MLGASNDYQWNTFIEASSFLQSSDTKFLEEFLRQSHRHHVAVAPIKIFTVPSLDAEYPDSRGGKCISILRNCAPTIKPLLLPTLQLSYITTSNPPPCLPSSEHVSLKQWNTSEPVLLCLIDQWYRSPLPSLQQRPEWTSRSTNDHDASTATASPFVGLLHLPSCVSALPWPSKLGSWRDWRSSHHVPDIPQFVALLRSSVPALLRLERGPAEGQAIALDDADSSLQHGASLHSSAGSFGDRVAGDCCEFHVNDYAVQCCSQRSCECAFLCCQSDHVFAPIGKGTTDAFGRLLQQLLVLPSPMYMAVPLQLPSPPPLGNLFPSVPTGCLLGGNAAVRTFFPFTCLFGTTSAQTTAEVSLRCNHVDRKYPGDGDGIQWIANMCITVAMCTRPDIDSLLVSVESHRLNVGPASVETEECGNVNARPLGLGAFDRTLHGALVGKAPMCCPTLTQLPLSLAPRRWSALSVANFVLPRGLLCRSAWINTKPSGLWDITGACARPCGSVTIHRVASVQLIPPVLISCPTAPHPYRHWKDSMFKLDVPQVLPLPRRRFFHAKPLVGRLPTKPVWRLTRGFGKLCDFIPLFFYTTHECDRSTLAKLFWLPSEDFDALAVSLPITGPNIASVVPSRPPSNRKEHPVSSIYITGIVQEQPFDATVAAVQCDADITDAVDPVHVDDGLIGSLSNFSSISDESSVDLPTASVLDKSVSPTAIPQPPVPVSAMLRPHPELAIESASPVRPECSRSSDPLLQSITNELSHQRNKYSSNDLTRMGSPSPRRFVPQRKRRRCEASDGSEVPRHSFPDLIHISLSLDPIVCPSGNDMSGATYGDTFCPGHERNKDVFVTCNIAPPHEVARDYNEKLTLASSLLSQPLAVPSHAKRLSTSLFCCPDVVCIVQASDPVELCVLLLEVAACLDGRVLILGLSQIDVLRSLLCASIFDRSYCKDPFVCTHCDRMCAASPVVEALQQFCAKEKFLAELFAFDHCILLASAFDDDPLVRQCLSKHLADNINTIVGAVRNRRRACGKTCRLWILRDQRGAKSETLRAFSSDVDAIFETVQLVPVSADLFSGHHNYSVTFSQVLPQSACHDVRALLEEGLRRTCNAGDTSPRMISRCLQQLLSTGDVTSVPTLFEESTLERLTVEPLMYVGGEPPLWMMYNEICQADRESVAFFLSTASVAKHVFSQFCERVDRKLSLHLFARESLSRPSVNDSPCGYLLFFSLDSVDKNDWRVQGEVLDVPYVLERVRSVVVCTPVASISPSSMSLPELFSSFVNTPFARSVMRSVVHGKLRVHCPVLQFPPLQPSRPPVVFCQSSLSSAAWARQSGDISLASIDFFPVVDIFCGYTGGFIIDLATTRIRHDQLMPRLNRAVQAFDTVALVIVPPPQIDLDSDNFQANPEELPELSELCVFVRTHSSVKFIFSRSCEVASQFVDFAQDEERLWQKDLCIGMQSLLLLSADVSDQKIGALLKSLLSFPQLNPLLAVFAAHYLLSHNLLITSSSLKPLCSLSRRFEVVATLLSSEEVARPSSAYCRPVAGPGESLDFLFEAPTPPRAPDYEGVGTSLNFSPHPVRSYENLEYTSHVGMPYGADVHEPALPCFVSSRQHTMSYSSIDRGHPLDSDVTYKNYRPAQYRGPVAVERSPPRPSYDRINLDWLLQVDDVTSFSDNCNDASNFATSTNLESFFSPPPGVIDVDVNKTHNRHNPHAASFPSAVLQGVRQTPSVVPLSSTGRIDVLLRRFRHA